jgi:drug/metabolite transporter (DMT)-like permease
MSTWRHPGVLAAFGAALLFGASTPLAKLLLGSTSPWLLAALLYLGSGLGLLLARRLMRATKVSVPRNERWWLAGAIAAGGIVAPVLLLYGLAGMPASGASLLLNAEGLFTALIAWFAFKENFDRRILAGMLLIVAGAAVLSWPGQADFGTIWPALAVMGACLAWGLDNNLTRRVSLADATFIAMAKGLAAGAVNLVIAFFLGATLPAWTSIGGALLLGFFSYGLSLTLFVLALRHLGTARTGAYFSTAPFAGAALSLVLLGEPFTAQLAVAAAFMAAGVWLHLSERHQHRHTHEALEHAHEHEHDAHHDHVHDPAVKSHTHAHRHEATTHEHPHFPDSHHRHKH